MEVFIYNEMLRPGLCCIIMFGQTERRHEADVMVLAVLLYSLVMIKYWNAMLLRGCHCILHLGILIHQGPPVTQSVVFGVRNENTLEACNSEKCWCSR